MIMLGFRILKNARVTAMSKANPCETKTAKAIVDATTYFNKPEIVAKVSEGLGDAMKGLDIKELEIRLQERGD